VIIRTILDGGAGNDTLTGGWGRDTVTGGLGDDVLDGGPGLDRLVESADVDMTLVQGSMRADGHLEGPGFDVLVRNRIEEAELTGGPGNNRLDATRFTGVTWLRGGDGNDTLLGGSSSDILLGGYGDDLLDGGRGRDILIGSLGSDVLLGGLGSDLLMAGDFIYESNSTALRGYQAEWTSAASYDLRVNHLTGRIVGGLHLGFWLNDTSAVDDGASTNTLTGGGDQDYFVVSAGDTFDLQPGEQKFTAR